MNMGKHFENRETALADLLAHGFREIKSGEFISKCREITATLHPTQSGMTLCVYWWATR
jgi:hypothetical protein